MKIAIHFVNGNITIEGTDTLDVSTKSLKCLISYYAPSEGLNFTWRSEEPKKIKTRLKDEEVYESSHYWLRIVKIGDTFIINVTFKE